MPPERDVFVPPYAEKGCWARFYADAGFGVPMREVEGPMQVEALGASAVVLPDSASAGVRPRFTEVRSLVLGPHARIVGYAQPLFREPSVMIDRGTSVADLATLDFHKRVTSFEMLCEAG